MIIIITCRVSVIDYESFLIHGFMESTTYHPCLNITLIPKVWFVFGTAPAIKIMINFVIEKQMKSTTYDPCVSITFISKVNWKYFQNTCMIIEKVPPRLPFLSIWKMWLLWFQGRDQLAMKVLQGMMKGEEVNQGGHQGMKRVSGSGRYFGMTYIDLFLLMVMNFFAS